MITYKVVKIWFVKANSRNEALNSVGGKEPDFISANDKFRVGKDKTRRHQNEN